MSCFRDPQVGRERQGASVVLLAIVALFAAGCGRDQSDAPTGPAPRTHSSANTMSEDEALVQAVRLLAAGRGIGQLQHPAPVREPLVHLGRMLAFDKILSGNRNMACMTCHLPAFGTSDGLRLSIGQSGLGLGPDRHLGNGVIIPRNAPSMFNLGALGSLFWDGRVSRDSHGDFHTPAGASLGPEMARVFEFGVVSAQGLFPVTSREEMRGIPADALRHQGGSVNELAAISDDDFAGIWKALMVRLGEVPEYRRLFEQAYPGTSFRKMTFAHAANAMAGFFIDRLSFNDSPWDRFLAGNDHALSSVELNGAKDFLTARCSICHNGAALTDGKFHNVALVQFGPGKGNGPGGLDDFGRMNITGDPHDRYAFRTTPLRNVELTSPYGHAGQFSDLRDFVAHYSESETNLFHFDVQQLAPDLRGTFVHNAADVMATRDTLLKGVVFTPQVIDEVTAFMRALTDPAARHVHAITPQHVPSGLPVDRP